MKSTAGPPSDSGNIREDPQEIQLTYEYVLRLLNVESLPFLNTPELKLFAVRGTRSILQRHPPEWIKEHRVRLIEELEQISEM